MIAETVERGDLDELLRLVDGLCAARDWGGLLELRDGCARAVERGKQLWPAAHHAEYRLALEAPGRYAARVLVEGAGRFTPGPLAEVAASTHAWGELAGHVTDGPVAAMCLHERVVRGEDLRAARLPGPDPLELPRVLQGWEPGYALASYRPDGIDTPMPAPPAVAQEVVELPHAVDVVDAPAPQRALGELTRAWVEESEGWAETVAVRGDVRTAIAGLGARHARVGMIDGASALALMAWAAASGGAHGRRRGAATGRLDAWVAGAVVAGLASAWPPPADALGSAMTRLRWYTWDTGSPRAGWSLRLAVEDRERELAYALDAQDPAPGRPGRGAS